MKKDKRCNFCRNKVTDGRYIKSTRKDICICDSCVKSAMRIIKLNQPR